MTYVHSCHHANMNYALQKLALTQSHLVNQFKRCSLMMMMMMMMYHGLRFNSQRIYHEWKSMFVLIESQIAQDILIFIHDLMILNE